MNFWKWLPLITQVALVTCVLATTAVCINLLHVENVMIETQTTMMQTQTLMMERAKH